MLSPQPRSQDVPSRASTAAPDNITRTLPGGSENQRTAFFVTTRGIGILLISDLMLGWTTWWSPSTYHVAGFRQGPPPQVHQDPRQPPGWPTEGSEAHPVENYRRAPVSASGTRSETAAELGQALQALNFLERLLYGRLIRRCVESGRLGDGRPRSTIGECQRPRVWSRWHVGARSRLSPRWLPQHFLPRRIA